MIEFLKQKQFHMINIKVLILVVDNHDDSSEYLSQHEIELPEQLIAVDQQV